ncbi:hypothetical protein BCR35DRAFT_263823 [Leucosporidium creatinivorum]|uniref:Tyr recombinase domain-containing protein n=1 Tax=Leucosporidium creatinivorum TaxID=106004 RepID=A0A1Y2FVR9_9BASI|nr:hypothetical protein BCR35DRAFT_263823 [Leucosporidium creatinivorum]
MRELGAILRFRRRKGEDGSDHRLWKSDVSGAFRNLPVSVYWQFKQVQRVRITVNGRHRWIYYVDRRLSLGGRCSPRIFCSVINCIMYCTKVRFALDYPLIFVDDAYGLDVSGLFLSVTHPVTGETRLVPLEQAKVLLGWTHVGMPWDWKKQEHHSSTLVILGHLVNSEEGTVTLPIDKKLQFAASVDSFLASRRPPLVEWQRIAGYAQWACYTLPFAKFALQPLYDKTRGKTKRSLGIPINTTVRRRLKWFVAELLAAEPLSFFDPALEEWTERDADLVIFTDACLVTEEFALPGLGFVAFDIIEGRRGFALPFFHRSPSPLGDIQLVEGLAVAAAIAWALVARPLARRIIIRTDSAPVVYAFDAGSGSSALRSLVWSSYQQLQRAKVDIRVKHIAGVTNKAADDLSRLDSAFLAFKERSTRRGYATSYKQWTLFTRTYNLPLRPSTRSLFLFAAFLQSKGYKTLPQFFTAVAYEWKPRIRNWDEIRSHPRVVDAIKGALKTNSSPTRRSPALIPAELNLFFTTTLSSPFSHDDLLALTIAVVGFGALMRLGELVEPEAPDDRDLRKYIKRSSARLVGIKEFHFHLPYHKADRSWRGSDVLILKENSIPDFNFVKLISLYLTSRDRLPRADSPFLFIRMDGSLPRREWFINRLRVFAPVCSGHSLRAGGATYLASIGTAPAFIQRMGRWSSNAFGIYLRDQPALSAAVSRLHLAALQR